MNELRNTRDTIYKNILKNNRFMADFLRDFTNITLFNDIEPDDIEDISERLTPFIMQNKDCDTVKRINLNNSDNPFFVITIVEHESEVNFRMPYKMFQYIDLILENYEKEVNASSERKIAETKDFKYPPVIPIVFYDGKSKWTAETNFFNKTSDNEMFSRFIPKFEYLLVDLNKYSIEDIINFGDALSLVLMFDKIDTKEKLSVFKEISEEQLRKFSTLKLPEDIKEILSDVAALFLKKINAPDDEIKEMRNIITNERVPKMFETLDYDVQEERRLAREEGWREAEKKFSEEVEATKRKIWQEAEQHWREAEKKFNNDLQLTRRQVWQEAEQHWQEAEKKYESQLAEERKRNEELQKQLDEIRDKSKGLGQVNNSD